ncbi:hypothetical protein [Methylophaga sp.]|uniref:hypothetical protein n=1 Tax=Methylophaga sp. TaxID=2024840 RepID=UPI003F6F441E
MEKEIELPIALLDSLVGITVFQKKLLYCLFYRNSFMNVFWDTDEPSILNFTDYQLLMSDEIVAFDDYEIIIQCMESLKVQIDEQTSTTKMFKKIMWIKESQQYFFFYDDEFGEKMFKVFFI